MKTVIVPIKGGWLHQTSEGYYLFEVDKTLLIEVDLPAGIHELEKCKTLEEVRSLVQANRNMTIEEYHRWINRMTTQEFERHYMGSWEGVEDDK